MNKTHAIAKIAVIAIGIYLLVLSGLALLSPLIMVVFSDSHFSATYSGILAAFAVILAAFFAAVYYFLIHRSSSIVQKIVGKDDLPDPINPLAWYPFALRLAVVIAGFFFLAKSISMTSILFNTIQFSLQEQGTMVPFYKQLFYTLLQLAISNYLLCGAPQFVRWQMRKSRELCSGLPADVQPGSHP